MSQTVTENLFNHDVSITTTGGVELTVDLSAAPWNRTTIADGWWLQNRTNSAFSARDIYLANCIDEINDNIADIRGGYTNSLMSMNNVIYSANDYWNGLPPTIAPSNTSKPAPSNTLTYMTVGVDTDLGTEDISLINDRTCIIQGNLTENSFNQILMNTNGLFYRSVSGDTVNSVTGEKIDNYDLLETDTQFSQILDDSTINTPGYWFLHKETSGRPVWTNINALAEYIDNRVNPDGVYIDWSATNILGYDTRILTILPPTENNINSSIDVTDIAYNNNAYLWSDGGWVECQPLMSRTEIEEMISSGGETSIKDFLSLFTANGSQAHYTNFGSWIQSNVNEEGRAYFTVGSSPDYYYYVTNDAIDSAISSIPRVPSYPGTSSCWWGAPRWVHTLGDYNQSALSGQWASCSSKFTCHFAGTTAAYNTYNKVFFTYAGSSAESAGSAESASNYIPINHPIYIKLAPLTYLNEESDNPTNPLSSQIFRKYNNVGRNWNIHFCIKGYGIFPWRFDNAGGSGGNYTPTPALVDVSIHFLSKNLYNNDSLGHGYDASTGYYTPSKSYYINEGEFVRTTSALTSNRGLTSVKPSTELSETTSGVVFITKEIDYQESISACAIKTTPTGNNYDYYEPWLRVCLKGIYPVYTRTTGNYENPDYDSVSATRLCIVLSGDSHGVDGTNYSYSNPQAFIEEYTDDRFMSIANQFVNS